MSTAAVTPNQDFQYIKLPDGSYGKFRSDLPDEQIKSAISKDFPDAYSQEPAPQTMGQKVGSVLGDVAAGAGKGLLHTGTALSPLINKIPGVGKYLAPQEGIAAAEKISKPINTAQKVGYYGEQGAEFLLPTGVEEKAGAGLARAIPAAADAAPKLVPAVGRIGMGAIDSAAINKLQGGDAGTGAKAGVIGGILGEGGRAVAPAIAESALGIQKRMRGYGKTPGAAVLDEISGVRPGTILKNASAKTGQLTNQIEGMAAAHPGTIDMRPAIAEIDKDIVKAAGQNNGKAIAQLNEVKGALTKNAVNGLPLAADQTATGALNLKRGVRNQFITNWNPETMTGTRAVAAKAGHVIDTGLDSALGPQFGKINQRVSSLIPVAERAESLERGAPMAQRALHTVAAHTGALAGAVGGGYYGYEHRGIPGMVGGAMGGVLLPELIASPEVGILAARALHSGAPVNAAKGILLQLNRPSKDTESDEESK